MPTSPNLDLRIALEAALKRRLPDDLIGTYRDFVQWRDLLPHMRYNPKVMQSIAQLAANAWHGAARVNRYELMRCMVRYRTRQLPMAYYGPKEEPKLDLLPETNALLFGLCLQIMTSRHLPVSSAQAADVKRYANVLMMRVRLNDERVDELVMALTEEPKLVNRLLRYPETNPAISHWARQEMQHTEWAYRRGELAAWVLNEDSDYVVPETLLRADFEEMNRRDSEIAARHLQAAQQQVRLQHDFPDLFSEPEDVLGFLYTEDQKRMRKQDEALRRFNEMFPIRPGMKMPMTYSQTMKIYVPDLAKGKQVFEANLDKIRSNCMLRAVRHCRLPDKTKLSLFKKYYHPANDFQAVTIAKTLGHAGMLRWLLEKAGR
jgi:hypothetical protein